MTRTRNLVVACDGTWNEPERLANGKAAGTNVVKFLSALAKRKDQRQHYEKGVGTRAWEALAGGVYGYGLDKRILGGYRFLWKRFRDAGWDNKVFVIGFSRGAYTARRLCGLIAHSGLPKKSTDLELGWELYKQRDERNAKKLKSDGRFTDIPIEMVGVWDTVKATNDPDYHDNKLSASVVAGYHAMAVDEKRSLFPILRWNKNARAKQLWFAGVHSDVGGGYAAQGLSDIALRWMIDQGLRHGLKFKANYVRQNVKPRPDGKIHESLQGIWVPLGKRKRAIPQADLVHESVRTRMQRTGYRPQNLPEAPQYSS